MLFPVLYLGARLYHKQPIRKPAEMDFVSNIAEIEAETYVLLLLRSFSYGLQAMMIPRPKIRGKRFGLGW